MLRPLVDRMAGTRIRPNHLTVAAVLISGAAGAAVGFASSVPALLWAVPALYLIRMALNAMDGLLARRHNLMTRGGAILNELGDVCSDSVAYLPFAFLLPNQAVWVVAAVVLGLISETTALAASDDSGRRNDGPLGKSDRALAFGAMAVFSAAGVGAAATPLLVLMVVLGVLTIKNRAAAKTQEVAA